MATLLTRNYFPLRVKRDSNRQQSGRVYTWCKDIRWSLGWKGILKNTLGVLVGAGATCGALLYFLDRSVRAGEYIIHPPRYPWDFEGYLTSLDHSAVRRGWQVYRTVCSTCHSLRYVRFMDLINVTHTEDEVKAIAAEYEIEDGPNEEGDYYTRPGRLSDLLPHPYPNEEAARAANFGAYPPDLTYFIFSRWNGRNYLFSVLTGFMDPPAGVSLSDQQYFNAYFPGNVIGMGQNLMDGAVDYDDGTPATTSQMAKDLVQFLSWTSSQNFDARKQMFIRVVGAWFILWASVVHYLRSTWSLMRTRQIAYIPKEK
ncbi:hypothetical protein ACFW04_000318 [Cataglyphis niger]